MKRLLIPTLALLLSSGAAHADAAGTWRTSALNDGSSALIEIRACDGAPHTYCGTIVEIFNFPNQDRLGEIVLRGMEAKDSQSYAGGEIYAPDEDKWYSSKMKVDNNTLEVSGCVLGGLICRSQTWTKAS